MCRSSREASSESMLVLIVIACLLGAAVGASNSAKEAMLLNRLRLGLIGQGEGQSRVARNAPKTQRVLLDGLESRQIHRECLLQSKNLTADQLRILGSPIPSRSKSMIELYEFIHTSNRKADLGSFDFVRAEVSIPAHLLRTMERIHFLRCVKDENGRLIVEEHPYRRTKSRNEKDARTFDVRRLFKPKESNIGIPREDFEYFVAIMYHRRTPRRRLHQQLPRDSHSAAVESAEANPRRKAMMHVSSLPKPQMHLEFLEPKMIPEVFAAGRGRRVTRRVCQDNEDNTGNGTDVVVPRRCCLRRMQVNFAELGWDFVAEPKSMTFHYCDGYCPHPYGGGNSETIDSSLKTFFSGARPAVGQLCCTAAAYRPHHVDVRTPHGVGIEIRSFDDVDAMACSCLT